MYAVIALFDENTEREIKDIWFELKRGGLSNYVDDMRHRMPHITLATYDNIRHQQFVNKLVHFYKGQYEIKVEFNAVGTFLKSGVVFLAPTVTRELLSLHEKHHLLFDDYNRNPTSHYLPGRWTPHTTISSHLHNEKIAGVYRYGVNLSPIKGKITGIALIESFPGNRVEIIFRKRLKKIEKGARR
ncbi:MULTISPECIES: 2'-5' RNA ligase family protein [unclassified Listeria]|uniref:2'-5' RNA ligase family protein n=1 Tax=unclassified Listeria TaxID=2642072 RepID=UPI000B587C01|nr:MULTISPECIES: 2'-5' RNA ligase family protein [unclassified Listeria]